MTAKRLKNILIYFIHDRKLKRYAVRYIKGRLIDIGCGTKPYKNLLAPHVTEHVGVDHEGTLHDRTNVDLFGTAYEILLRISPLIRRFVTQSWSI